MKLEWERLSVRPERPFRISRSTEERVERVWVRVEADGLSGRGEAAPQDYYGETADSVEEALDAMRPVLEAAGDPERLERLERQLVAAVAGSGRPSPTARQPAPSARAAVMAALCDLAGKRRGAPLWRLWGLDPGDAPPSSFTLGIDEPGVMGEKARAARGWPVLKVKLGLEDGDEERAIIEAVRSEAPEATLRVDANAGWTAGEALRRIEWLGETGVEFVEQPLPPEDREGLAWLRDRSPLPVILDESCMVSSDVPALADLCHGVNVKLAKSGGPREALRAIHAARACGLSVMLGCMLETSLGVAPAAHLAPLADHVDLDGAVLLAEDPFRGPGPAVPGDEPSGPAGRIVLGQAPGLGVERRR